MRRCGFFLQVFGLIIPDYLECSVFPEKKDDCVGYHEVIEAQQRAKKPRKYNFNYSKHLL